MWDGVDSFSCVADATVAMVVKSQLVFKVLRWYAEQHSTAQQSIAQHTAQHSSHAHTTRPRCDIAPLSLSSGDSSRHCSRQSDSKGINTSKLYGIKLVPRKTAHLVEVDGFQAVYDTGAVLHRQRLARPPHCFLGCLLARGHKTGLCPAAVSGPPSRLG